MIEPVNQGHHNLAIEYVQIRFTIDCPVRYVWTGLDQLDPSKQAIRLVYSPNSADYPGRNPIVQHVTASAYLLVTSDAYCFESCFQASSPVQRYFRWSYHFWTKDDQEATAKMASKTNFIADQIKTNH